MRACLDKKYAWALLIHHGGMFILASRSFWLIASWISVRTRNVTTERLIDCRSIHTLYWALLVSIKTDRIRINTIEVESSLNEIKKINQHILSLRLVSLTINKNKNYNNVDNGYSQLYTWEKKSIMGGWCNPDSIYSIHMYKSTVLVLTILELTSSLIISTIDPLDVFQKVLFSSHYAIDVFKLIETIPKDMVGIEK